MNAIPSTPQPSSAPASLAARSLRSVWHPCTQMQLHEATPPVAIARAQGVVRDRDRDARRQQQQGIEQRNAPRRNGRERTAHGHPNHPTLDTQGALEA